MSIKKSQVEEISFRCSLIEQRLNNILLEFSNHQKDKLLVASEIEKFINKKIQYNDEAVKHWEKRYEDELQIYKTKIKILTENIAVKENTLKELEETYKNRQLFIDKYLREKEINRLQKEAEEYKIKCTIKIQSWWRGMMVRKKLGPHRLDDRKKKRPNKPKK